MGIHAYWVKTLFLCVTGESMCSPCLIQLTNMQPPVREGCEAEELGVLSPRLYDPRTIRFVAVGKLQLCYLVLWDLLGCPLTHNRLPIVS